MTTESEKGAKADGHSVAFAAIGMLSNRCRGTAPQWHELDALHKGYLAQPRLGEVLSHIANDPDCFQQWLDLAEAEAWVEEELTANKVDAQEEFATTTVSNVAKATVQNEQRDSLSTSLLSTLKSLRIFLSQPLPVYGGALAAILLAVIVAPLLLTGGAPNLEEQIAHSMNSYIDTGGGLSGAPPITNNTRSMSGLFDDLSTNDVERQYVQNGMRQVSEHLDSANTDNAQRGDEWRTLLSELNATPPACDEAIDQTHCIEVADDYRMLGQYTMTNTAACQHLLSDEQPVSDANFWPAQYSLYRELRSVPAIANSALYAPILVPLSEQTPEALCQRMSAVLSTTL